MRISTSLPDGKWREVGEAARRFEELGFDQAAAHEVQHDSDSGTGHAVDEPDRAYNLGCDCLSS